MNEKKVVAIKKQPEGSMPSFIEPAFARISDEREDGWFIFEGDCNDEDAPAVFVTTHQLLQLCNWFAGWLLSEGELD